MVTNKLSPVFLSVFREAINCNKFGKFYQLFLGENLFSIACLFFYESKFVSEGVVGVFLAIVIFNNVPGFEQFAGLF